MQGEIVNPWPRAGFTALLVTHDVVEALLMATRIIVSSDRPMTIKADIAVEKPYPRHRGDPDPRRNRQEILELLGLQRSRASGRASLGFTSLTLPFVSRTCFAPMELTAYRPVGIDH
jgi:hypothetical protein